MLVVDHAIALLLTHKLNMEDKHTKSLKSMKIFFTEKFFHARVMEKQSTARIINSHQMYRIQFEVKKVLLFAAIRAEELEHILLHTTSFNTILCQARQWELHRASFYLSSRYKGFINWLCALHCELCKSMHRSLIYKLCRLLQSAVPHEIQDTVWFYISTLLWNKIEMLDLVKKNIRDSMNI